MKLFSVSWEEGAPGRAVGLASKRFAAYSWTSPLVPRFQIGSFSNKLPGKMIFSKHNYSEFVLKDK
jgi:hypothetical protein